MIIPLIIGAVAIFIWSQLSPKKPVEKTELLESPLTWEAKDILGTLKTGAAKVAGIVGGGAGVVKVAGGAAAIGGTAIAVSALPAATVLPAGLSAMAPTTLTSAAYGTTPAIVGSGSGVSSVGAGGASGAGAAIGGAAMVAAPLVVVPVIAKALDWIFGIGESGLHDDPELLARQLQITKEKEEMIAAAVPGGAVPSWDPKSGFWEGDPG